MSRSNLFPPRDAGPRDVLTAAEECDLARRLRAGDGQARARLIEANIPLAVGIARSFAARHPGRLADVEGAAMLGLVRAADRFDPDKGRFTTCAHPWIKKEIYEMFAGESCLVRMPRHLFWRLHKRGELPATAARGTTGMAQEDDPIGQLVAPDDDPVPGPGGVDLGDLRDAVDRLPADLADLVRLRWPAGGRLDDRPMQSDVGARIGVSRRTVSTRQKAALDRLRRDLAGEAEGSEARAS